MNGYCISVIFFFFFLFVKLRIVIRTVAHTEVVLGTTGEDPVGVGLGWIYSSLVDPWIPGILDPTRGRRSQILSPLVKLDIRTSSFWYCWERIRIPQKRLLRISSRDWIVVGMYHSWDIGAQESVVTVNLGGSRYSETMEYLHHVGDSLSSLVTDTIAPHLPNALKGYVLEHDQLTLFVSGTNPPFPFGYSAQNIPFSTTTRTHAGIRALFRLFRLDNSWHDIRTLVLSLFLSVWCWIFGFLSLTGSIGRLQTPDESIVH